MSRKREIVRKKRSSVHPQLHSVHRDHDNGPAAKVTEVHVKASVDFCGVGSGSDVSKFCYWDTLLRVLARTVSHGLTFLPQQEITLLELKSHVCSLPHQSGHLTSKILKTLLVLTLPCR